jgi:hypothetical protein
MAAAAARPYSISRVIYCVIPRELEGELFDKLTAYYADDPNVVVKVDERKHERRRRGEPVPEGAPQRQVRDRRRPRVTGELPDVIPAAE